MTPPHNISLYISVLTVTTQTTYLLSILPQVSYMKAVDLWMLVCLVFVFAAFLEFAAVNVLNQVRLSACPFGCPTSRSLDCPQLLPPTLSPTRICSSQYVKSGASVCLPICPLNLPPTRLPTDVSHVCLSKSVCLSVPIPWSSCPHDPAYTFAHPPTLNFASMLITK